MGSCPYQHHLWEGPNFQGGEPGPIYDLDTKYFWRPGSARTDAQFWEKDSHRVTNPNLQWAGHCAGVSCAQAMELDPPVDCGALTRDDLEGLLGETWMDADALQFGDGSSPIKPSSMWVALRACLGLGQYHRPFVVDFYTDGPGSYQNIEWNYPVFAYEMEYDVNETVFPAIATVDLTLHYEDHVYEAGYAPGNAAYQFNCPVQRAAGGLWIPLANSGTWLYCHGPGQPPYNTTAPQCALLPTGRSEERHSRNPCINYDTLKRVIDHTTIVMDDEFMFDADPYPPPDTPWVQRPGYSGSCWAVPGCYEQPWFFMSWRPRLGRSGPWRFKVYKTPQAGNDTLNRHVELAGIGPWPTFYNQAEAPFDTWVQVGRDTVLPAGTFIAVYVSNRWAIPLPCLTYMDAFRAEYIGPSGDGGASSSAVALGDETQRVRVMPNPVGRIARISYTVPNSGPVVLAVYDVTGRVVLRAAQGIQHAGAQNATISVAGLPAGTYMARVSVNGVNTTCRFVVCR